MAQKSAFIAQSYLDNNYDSTSSNNELLSEIEYITQGTVVENEDQKEITFIKGVTPYRLTNVSVKNESIGDMTYHSKKNKIAVLPRKGVSFPPESRGSPYYPRNQRGETRGNN